LDFDRLTRVWSPESAFPKLDQTLTHSTELLQGKCGSKTASSMRAFPVTLMLGPTCHERGHQDQFKGANAIHGVLS
jgi:hypothetical protein